MKVPLFCRFYQIFHFEINWPIRRSLISSVSKTSKHWSNKYVILIFCFSQKVSTETILFWKCKMWKCLPTFRIMAFFYFMNWIVAAETIKEGENIQARKLFVEIWYIEYLYFVPNHTSFYIKVSNFVLTWLPS